MSANDYAFLKIVLKDPAEKLPSDDVICNYVCQTYQTRITSADVAHLDNHLVIRLCLTGSRSELGLPKSETINEVVYKLTECEKGESAHLFNMDEMNGSERERATVLVTGLPKGFTKEVVELIFENKAKSGGGPISEIVPEPGPAPCRALITFEQALVAQRVVSKGQVTVKQCEVCMCWPPPCDTVSLTGLPADMDDEDIELVLTSPRHCALSGTVKLTKVDGKVHVKLDSEQAAQAFAKRGSFQYKNKIAIELLRFELPEEARGGSPSDEHFGKKEQAAKQLSEFRCVIVSGFSQPLSADEVEQLELVFENEVRSGGGPLECPAEVNDDRLQLAITYQSADVAARVVSRSPLTHKNYFMTIVPAPGNIVQVSGVGGDTDTEDISLLLASKKCGFSSVDEIIDSRQAGTFYAVMTTDDDAQKVIGYTGIVYNKCELSFTLMKFGLPLNAGSQPPDVEPKSPNAGPKSPNAGRKSPNAGRKPPNAGRKSPVAGRKPPAIGPKPSVAGLKPQVAEKAVEPDKSAESEKNAEPEGETLSTQDTIVVRGVTTDIERDLKNLMENKGRSGGGPLRACVIDTSLGQALVTFRNAADASRVINRKEALVLRNVTLTVTWPPPANTVKITGFTGTAADHESLTLFLETSEFGSPHIASLKPYPDGIIYAVMDTEQQATDVASHSSVKYSSDQLTLEVMKFFLPSSDQSEGTTYIGKRVSKGSVPLSNDNQATILVKGISDHDTERSLKLFFENERLNKGGHLAGDLIINRDLQAAVVTFEQEEVAARMIEKQSVEFQGHTLEIQPAPPRNMVLLDDVPQSLHLDTVTLAMDNYGPVKDIWPSCQPGQLVVFFINEQDAIELATNSEVEVTEFKLKVSQLKFGLMAKGGGSLLCRTVLVSNIPATMQEIDLRKHLASIGGPIEQYQPVPNSPRCLVTFTDHKGAKSVVDKKKTTLSGMELYFGWPVLEPEWHKGRQPQEQSRRGQSLQSGDGQAQSGDGQPGQSLSKQSDQSREDQSNGGLPDQSGDQSQSRGEEAQTQGGEQPQSVLYVYGIPPDMHSDVIRNYFSNKRNGGGPIDNMDRSDSVTCIHFKQAQVASQLAAKGSVEVSKHTLQVSHIPRRLQQQLGDGAAGGGESGAVAGGTTVTLKGFKPATHDDTIKDFIQNRKVAGSKTIREFTRSGNTATIVFNEAAVAEKVSKMKQLSLEGASITATLVQPPQQPSTDVVVMKGLSADITDDALMNALELHLCDDCEVKEVNRLSTTDALITFTDAHSGKVALERKEFTLQGKTVTFHPHIQSQAVDKGESVDTEPIRTLMLTGFKPKTERSKLFYFLETKKKSGGGDIADLSYNDDEQYAIVTFEREQDARGVLAMKPLMFDDCKLKTTVLVTLVDEKGEPVKSHTIVVSGLTDKVAKDTLIMVLETKKQSGGGDIVDGSIYMDKSAGKAVVAFKEAAAAERVSQKEKLEVGGCWVIVNLLPARPLQRVLGETYPTMAVVKHFREDCPTRILKAFLQEKSQTTVTDIEYSLRPSVAIVHFDKTPDFRAIQVHCARFPCGGAMLSVTRAPVSDTVQVFGVKDVEPDWLEEFFANNSKSGGGEVSKFDMRSEENVALVSFVDKNVALELSKLQKLIFRNIHMQISLYHADMGIIPADHDRSKPGIIIPTHTDIPVANDKVMSFMVRTDVFKKNVEKVIKKLYATVDWDASEKLRSKLKVLCTLKHNVPQVHELVKTWKQSVETQMVKTLQENVTYHKQDVMSQFWAPLLQHTRKDTEKAQADSKDLFVVYYDEKSCCIEVVGLTDEMGPTVKRLQEALHDLEAEAERLSKTMTETLKLKTCQVVLLDQLGVFTQLKQQYPDVKLDVDRKTATVSVSGLLDDVRNIKLEVNNKTQNIAEQSVNIAPEFKPLFDDVSFTQDVNKLFQDDQLTVGWEVVDCGMLVCAVDANIVQIAAKLAAANLVPRHNTYDDASAAVLAKANWIQLKKRTIELKNDDDGVVIVSYSDTYNALLFSGASIKSPVIARMKDSWHAIDYYGLKTNVNAAGESVKEYLSEKVIYEQFHETSLGVAKLLEKNYRAEIEVIEKGVSDDLPVKIAIKDTEEHIGFAIRGKKAIIEAAAGEMWKLVEKICRDTLIVNQPNAVRHLQTSTGKNSLLALEKTYPAVVLDADDERMSTKAGGAALGGQASIEICSVEIKGSDGPKYIYVLKTDLATVDCDAIVNAANDRLRLGAGVAGAIKSIGGPKIQEECDKHVNKRGTLSVGEVFTSTGGNLKCKKIIHAVGPHYKGGKMNEDNDLYDTVYNCLEEACRLKLESIAMPAISSGMFGFPLTKSVEVTVEAMGDFFESKVKDKVTVSLKKVYLVNNVALGVRTFVDVLRATYKDKVKAISSVKDDDLQPAGTFIADEPGSGPRYEEHHVPRHDAPRRDAPRRERSAGTTMKDSIDYGRVHFSVKVADLFKEKVDAIVITSVPKLDLNQGMVSKQLMAVAGQGIQAELKQQYPNGANYGDVVESSGGNLGCRSIYYVICGHYKPGHDADLSKMISACLWKAHQKKYKSIAFPTVGAGHLGYPKDVVSSAFVDSCKNFAQSNPQTSLTDVRLVVFHKDTDMLEAMKQKLGGDDDADGNSDDDSSEGAGARGGHGHFSSGKGSHGSDSGRGGYGGDLGGRSGGRGSGDSVKVGNTTLQVAKGDITQERSDVIVNSSNRNLDISQGVVSQNISRAAGQALADECKALGSTNADGIAVTGGYKLACRHIIHIDACKKDEDWRQRIIAVLTEVEKRKLKSVSFPALGTGKGGKDASLMAKLILETVISFCRNNRTGLELVRVVVFDDKTMTQFIDVLQQVTAGRGVEVKQSNGGNDAKRSTGGKPGSVPPRKSDVSESSKKNSITYVIYGKQQKDVDSVKKEILKGCDDSISIKQIAGEYSELIGQLNPQQIKSVQAVERDCVTVTISKGCIEIKGLHSEVSEATSAIHSILTRAREEKFVGVLTAEIQWLYEDNQGQYKEYSPQVIAKIEQAYQQKQPCRIEVNANKSYELDFKKMVQTSSVKGTERRIWRKTTSSASSINPPPNWTAMGQEHYVQIELKPTDTDYKIVSAAFTSTGGPNTILKIYRIQNPHLYQTYMVMKKEMERTGRTNTIETRPLWHGTAAPTVASVCTRGFDRSFCGKNATAYGKGVYFAVQASYSASPTYSPPEPVTNYKYMFCCRVLTGDYIVGTQTMNVPPVKSGTLLYDTLVDNATKPNMFITFNDSQAYPDFLVVFQ